MRRILFACSLALAAWHIAPAAAQTFNGQEQAEIRAIVREYLVRNPDVLREALDALEARVTAERWQEVKSDARDFSLGNASAPIVIVEYFDYRCPYCHAAYEWISDLARTRSDVRIVLKELPVLGPESMEAARAALASMPQGRYWQFHRAMITFRGDLTSERIDQLAASVGIDVPRMRRAMESPEITAQLEDVRAQAIEYNFNGTPGFVINGQTVPGFNPPLLEQRLREATRATRGARPASD
ncbi:MAG: DsbA family protein [Hyphomonadaceae bacterium]